MGAIGEMLSEVVGARRRRHGCARALFRSLATHGGDEGNDPFVEVHAGSAAVAGAELDATTAAFGAVDAAAGAHLEELLVHGDYDVQDACIAQELDAAGASLLWPMWLHLSLFNVCVMWHTAAGVLFVFSHV